jgi:hypothetical protein
MSAKAFLIALASAFFFANALSRANKRFDFFM